MPGNNNGGSTGSNEEVLFEQEFPKDGGGTVKATNDEKPADQKDSNSQTTDETQKEEEKKPDETGKNSQTDGTKDNNNGHTSQEQALHNKQLDFIESVMKQGDEQAKKYFQENPDYAAMANRSKRLKDSYRILYENKADDNTQVTKDDPNATAKTDAPDDAKDLATEDRVYNNILKREEKSMQSMQANEYAKANGVNKDDVDTLLESAQGLKVTTGQSFAQCLQGAHTALGGKTGGGAQHLTTPGTGGSGGDNNTAEVPDKEQEVARYMDQHKVDKKTAEKFYSQQYGNSEAKSKYTGELNSTYQVKR